MRFCNVFHQRAAGGEVGLGFAGEERRGTVGEFGGGEDGLEAVVVARGQRVELVVVAARALHGDAEERGGGGVGDVVEPLLAGDRGDAHAGVFPGSHAEEAGGDELFGVGPASSSPAICSMTNWL